MSFEGKVYDVSNWEEHPGGSAIFTHAGEDFTDIFAAFHPPSARNLLDKYQIGVLDESVLPQGKRFWWQDFDDCGYNFRMTDLQAAVGLVQLGRLPEIVARRREIAARYQAAIADIPGLRAVADPAHGTGNFQSFWVEVDDEYPTDREGLLEALAHAEISARRGIMASHRQPPYRGLTPEGGLPVTERLNDRTLILPVYHTLTDEDQDRVIAVLRHPGGRSE